MEKRHPPSHTARNDFEKTGQTCFRNFRVVNLRTGKAAYIMTSGELSETNMDEVESALAMRIVSENRKYITAA